MSSVDEPGVGISPLAPAAQDDLEARRMRQAVQASLFGAPVQPIKVDRYVILEQLGSGSAGIVYAAYDPSLDRRVALKVLRPLPARGGSSTEAGMARLQREARALAQLSHPNVVHVYDVGEVLEQVYVSMELIDGEDLDQWLDRGPHPWRNVVARFVQAGRGLAAAHAAGLVHRDFKPSNVLVGEDGRVRVVDFGLAKWAGRDDGGDEGVAGTPIYMSPEQHDGQSVDARSDQYSYCVALYVALFGRGPFEARSLDLLRLEKQDGVADIPMRAPTGRLPWWLRSALLRGLSADPQSRHASMLDLLGALEGNLVRRRPGTLLALGTTGIAAVLALRGRGEPGADSCEAAVARGEQVWNDDARQRIQAAFGASATAYAQDSAVRVSANLDEYARAWSSAQREHCEGAHEPSGDGAVVEQLERQVCLDQRLRDLAALVEVLGDADAAVVERSADVVRTLDPVDDCAAVGVPATAGVPATQRRELRAQLVLARAHRAAGKFADAEAVARRVRDEAAALGADALERRAALLSARLEDDLGRAEDAEAALLQTLSAAELASDDPVAIDALLELVFVIGVSRGRPEEGLRWAQLAAARVERTGTSRQCSRLYNHQGTLLEQSGQTGPAIEVLEDALRLRMQQGDLVAAASSANNLGNAHLRRGELDIARDLFEQAHTLGVEAHGEQHPSTALAFASLGSVDLKLGHWERATNHLLAAEAVLARSLGDEHPQLVGLLLNLGRAYQGLRAHDAAIAANRRALAIVEQSIGEDHLLAGYAHAGLGLSMARTLQMDGALVHYRRAVEVLEAGLEDDDPRLKEVRGELAALSPL